MDLMLKDKVALVTAASRGLGYAVAHALAAEGARVAICARNQNTVQAAADRITNETGADVYALAADLSQARDIERLCSNTLERFSRIDALFINAGGPPPGRFVDLNPESWQSAMNLTIESAVRLVYAVLPAMHANGSGSILANTSVTVRQPLDNLTLSNSLRAAVVGLVKTLSIELGPENIRVNAIAPGWTRTERVEQLLNARAEAKHTSVDQESASVTNDIPLRRIADPTEFARAAAFLLSPAASYITGVTLLVDGGLSRALL